MRATVAVVEPALDIVQISRAITKEHVALQDCDRNLEATEKQAHNVMRKAEGLRQEQSRRRIEIGRLLIEAKRSTKHGGWLPYLEKIGIEERNAQNWMRLAGFAESRNETETDVSYLPNAPTLADAGIDRRPRKRDEQPDPVEPSTIEIQTVDIDAELSRIDEKLRAFAKSVPVAARTLIAQHLRNTATMIEQMSKHKGRH